MSDGFGLIAIWSLNALRDPVCVNCIRWSPNGKWLSSCGTDKNVNIWEKIQGSRPHSIFGCKEQTRFSENWKLILTLRGHTGDVQDLDWHLSSRYLASSSVDTSIIIWYSSSNTHASFKQIAILKGHGGFVKGVTWDPVGRYLASQADDKTLRFWRVSDWSEETRVREIFDKTSTQSQFMRVSWSPCGSYIASTVAVENKENASECVVIAIGSKDRSISVWSTGRKRALVVLHDLFTQPISDLAWSKTNNELVVSSYDGSIAYISFTKDEIGTPYSEANTIKLHKKFFGCSALLSEIGQNDQDLINLSNTSLTAEKMIPETPEMLALQLEVLKETAGEKFNQDNNEKTVTKQIAKPTGPNKQIETRTTEGKRRITPKFLGSLEEDIHEELPVSVIPEESTSEKTDTKTIPEEKSAQPSQKISHPQDNVGRVDLDQTVDPPNHHIDNSNKKSFSAKGSGDDSSKTTKLKKRRRVVFDDSSSGSETEGLTSTKVNNNKKKSKVKDKTPTTSSDQSNLNENQTNTVKQVEIIEKRSGVNLFDEQSADLNPNNGQKKFVCSQDHRPRRNVSLITLSNDSTKKKFIISAARADKKIFTITEKSPITAFTHHENWFILGNSDGQISFYDSNTGDNLFPVIQTSNSPILRLILHESVDKHTDLYAIAGCGKIYIWHLPKDLMTLEKTPSNLFDEGQTFKRLLVKLTRQLDISDIIRGANKRLRCMTISNGEDICIHLAKGSSYLYHRASENWMILLDSEKDLFLFRFVHGLNSTNVIQGNSPTGILHSLQVVKQSQSVRGLSPLEMKSLVPEQKQLLIQFLKNQIRLCLLFESANELKFWTGRLVRTLVEFGYEEDLKSLFMDLIGPLHKDPPNWNKNILSLSKRIIATEFLKYFGLNLSLQKLYQELKETLDFVKN